MRASLKICWTTPINLKNSAPLSSISLSLHVCSEVELCVVRKSQLLVIPEALEENNYSICANNCIHRHLSGTVIWLNGSLKWNFPTDCNFLTFFWYFSKYITVFWERNSTIMFVYSSFYINDTYIRNYDPVEEKKLLLGYFPYQTNQKNPLLHDHYHRLCEQIEVYMEINESLSNEFSEMGHLENLNQLCLCALLFLHVYWSS